LPGSTGAILELASAFARVWTKLDAYYANEQFLPFGGQFANLYQFLLSNYGQEAIALANCRDCLCNGRNIFRPAFVYQLFKIFKTLDVQFIQAIEDTNHDSARIVRRMLKILDMHAIWDGFFQQSSSADS
jgi:hypothetical protein